MKLEINPMTQNFSVEVPELNNLINWVSNGIGTCYNDFWGAKKRIENFKLAGNLEVTYKDKKWELNKPSNELNFIERKELVKLTNTVKIVKESLIKLQEDINKNPNLKYSPPDNDWATIFLDNSQYVSDPNLKDIWANLLKNEITSERKSSKKTLEILKNLNSNEIKILKEMKKYLFYEIIQTLPNNWNIIRTIFYPFNSDMELRENNINIHFSDIQQIKSLNILYATDLTLTYENNINIIVNSTIMSNNSTKKINIIGLTREGEEIFDLIEHPNEYNPKFLDLFIKKHNFAIVNQIKMN